MTNNNTEVLITVAKHCDFCKEHGKQVVAKVDGKTKLGPWANMCSNHFTTHGMGLGLGLGQRLILDMRPKKG